MDASAIDDIVFDLSEMTAHTPNSALWVLGVKYIYPSTLGRRWRVKSPFSLYLRDGWLNGFINGVAYEIKEPSSLILREDDVFVITETSHFIEASVLYYNAEVAAHLSRQVVDYTGQSVKDLPTVFSIPAQYIAETDILFQWLKRHLGRSNSEWYEQGAMFRILQYFFNVACRFYSEKEEHSIEPAGAEIVRRFMELVDRYHAEQRFLDFYAQKIGIGTKHLSRTVKAFSGKSAVEWIDMMLLVDAKLLLTTTSMSVNEISEVLKFSSQSFFGKFFKKYTGISPTDYRKERG